MASPMSCTFYSKPFAVSGTQQEFGEFEFKYRKLSGQSRIGRFFQVLPYLWWVCK